MSINTPIHLEYLKTSSNEIYAVVLQTINPIDLINYVILNNYDQDDMQFYFFGETQTSPTPTHTIIIGHAPSTTQLHNAVPYKCCHKLLYIPLHSIIFPALTDQEVEATLDGKPALLHPGVGLFYFDNDFSYQLADLLEFPSVDMVSVTAGKPVPEIRQIQHIEFISDFNEDDLFTEESKTVGNKPLTDLQKPVEGVEYSNLQKPLAWTQKLLAKGILNLTNLAPDGASNPTWINRINDWASKKIHHISERMEASRNKELSRLLKLLKENPEEGLRYALPLDGQPGRGMTSNPSGHLSTRDTRFNVHGIGGGGITDFWDIEYEMRRKLTDSYVQLAQHEEDIGNYKRSAYIYSHLLAKYKEAAQVLEKGQHYREAAIIYEKHLSDKRKAAECLLRGGLSKQAGQKFESLGLFKEAAKCYEKIGNTDEAQRLWDVHIEKLINSNDWLEAGHYIHSKKRDLERALDLWLSAWPKHPQNTKCLKTAFDTLHHNEMHDRMELLLEEYTSKTYTTHHLSQFFNCCQYFIKSDYPSAVKSPLFDKCSVQLGNHIDKNHDQFKGYSKQLISLMPDDKLFHRDCIRISQQQKKKNKINYVIVNDAISINPTAHIKLPISQYVHAWCTGQSMLCISINEETLTICRISHASNKESIKWQVRGLDTHIPQIPTGIRDQNTILISSKIVDDISEKSFPANDHCPNLLIKGPHIDPVSAEILASCYGEYGHIFILYVNRYGTLSLEKWSDNSELLHSISLEQDDVQNILDCLQLNLKVHIGFLNNTLAIFANCTVHFIINDTGFRKQSVSKPILGIEQSNKWSNARWIILHEDGVSIVHCQANGLDCHYIPLSHPPQCSGFIGNYIVVLSTDTASVFKITQQKQSEVAKLGQLHHANPISVQRGKDNKQLCVFYDDGHIQFFNMPTLT